jgi:hypothetical protein
MSVELLHLDKKEVSSLEAVFAESIPECNAHFLLVNKVLPIGIHVILYS